MDALELLRSDHDKVNQIFKTFEQGGNSQEFQRLFNQLYQELTVHTTIEEQVFYPAVRQSQETNGLVQEAYEEHADAKHLLTEIASLDNTSEEWGRKMTQLMRAIQHHVEEEEGQLFPKVRQLFSPEQLQQLGQQLEQAKTTAFSTQPSNPLMGQTTYTQNSSQESMM